MATERRTTRSMKKGTGKVPVARRPIPEKKDPTLLIAGGVGGGAVLLLVVIAVASSGGTRRPPPEKPVEAPRVETHTAPPDTRSVSDTGAIMFICGGSAKHEDKEVILSQCPSCPASGRFYWDGGRYICQACSKAFDSALVACKECGRVPRVHRIKHR